jgi:hypothetical protein
VLQNEGEDCIQYPKTAFEFRLLGLDVMGGEVRFQHRLYVDTSDGLLYKCRRGDMMIMGGHLLFSCCWIFVLVAGLRYFCDALSKRRSAIC